jgi:hypothetical protein
LAGVGGVSVKHPDEAKRFSETMVAVHGAEPPAVAAAYDFSAFGGIVDVSGASEHMTKRSRPNEWLNEGCRGVQRHRHGS